MKLKPLLLIALLFSIFACTSDDSNNDDDDDDNGNTDSVLIKQINYSAVDDDYSYTETFNYDGTKLISIIDSESDSSDEYKATFDYNDDKLVQINYIEDDELVEYVTLTYNSNNILTSFKTFFWIDEEEFASNYIITYNENNSNLSLQNFGGDFSTQTEDEGTSNFIIENGNILEIDFSFDDDDDTYVWSFQYDSKNSIYKNIDDIEIIGLVMSHTEYGFDIFGASNNVIQFTDDQDIFYDVEEIVYSYNSNDYPSTAISYIDDELDSNIEFIYE
jgi:hypothetical protein